MRFIWKVSTIKTKYLIADTYYSYLINKRCHPGPGEGLCSAAEVIRLRQAQPDISYYLKTGFIGLYAIYN
ncbi:MAG: hypothetical protein JWR72_474 [Flavisolibacter sp.]|nr:hypothetical protein [Flavisolibacter sp.]